MDGVVHPNVEQAIGRDRIRKALKRYENRPADEHRYGIVRSVNEDGSYEVLLDGDVQTSRCVSGCTAGVGDRVLVCIMTNGRCVAVARLEGTEALFNKPIRAADNMGIFSGDHMHIPNSRSYRSYNADGTVRSLAFINSINNYFYGDGSYSGDEGTVFFEGNKVNIRAKGEVTITSPTAGLTNRAYGVNKVLASTASYMVADQTITLSEPVSAQPHGIVLVWSWYDGGAKNWDWVHKFIPKHHPNISSGGGVDMFAIDSGGSSHMAKYVYVTDTQIVGHSRNGSGAKTLGGLTVNNGNWVLRYVLGV